MATISASARRPISTCCCGMLRCRPDRHPGWARPSCLFAFRGWSVLLLAPAAALIAALFSREPLLAHWTQTFMGSAAGFLAQFFPLFCSARSSAS